MSLRVYEVTSAGSTSKTNRSTLQLFNLKTPTPQLINFYISRKKGRRNALSSFFYMSDAPLHTFLAAPSFLFFQNSFISSSKASLASRPRGANCVLIILTVASYNCSNSSSRMRSKAMLRGISTHSPLRALYTWSV